ncbi:MAG TPA: inositol monophosphatase family protein [Bacteroidales bacterium]|nr:inositol monophosphatase family protein [Bacteroidales bacterium]HPS62774.1 inositol monophosphatase family protein [Bacteroidales bacterium]
MNLEALTRKVCELAEETGQFLMQEVHRIRREDVEVKGLHNYVTHVDRESEQRLVDRLGTLLPGSGFIAEEDPNLKPGELTWVIDPLDGTTNFIHGVPLFSISIGLMQGDKTLLGVIREPNLGETFYTWEGAPSYLNGQTIRVSKTPAVSQALFATGFPYYDYSLLDDYLQLFRYLLQNSRGVRRLGSAAADLAYTACGRYDGFYEYGLSPWDVNAGGLIVKNAGGTVTDFRGTDNYTFGRQILAANPMIYDEFLTFFSTWKHELN